MNNKTGAAAGVALILVGIWVFSLGLDTSDLTGFIWAFIWGFTAIGLGLYLLLHLREEDVIEPIHKENNK